MLQEQAAKLLETLNGLIQQGAEKLSPTAEMMVGELQKYYLYNGIGFFIFVVALVVGLVGAFKLIKYGSDENEDFPMFMGVMSFIVLSVAFFICLFGSLDCFTKAIAPIGALVAKAL